MGGTGVERKGCSLPVGRLSALTFHRDVLDGEPEDDGPDHSQGHLRVAVHNLCTQGKGQRERDEMALEAEPETKKVKEEPEALGAILTVCLSSF